MKKKAFGYILTFVIIITLLLPVYTYGYVREGSGEAPLLQEGDYDIEFVDVSQYDLPLRSVQGVEEFIYSSLMDKTERINLAAYSIPVADFETLYSNVINDNPDLFFVSSSYRYSYYSDNTVAYVTPYYAMASDEIDDALDVYYTGVERALAEVDDSMDEMQKALTLHDYICSEANYPTLKDSSGNSLDKNIYHSAYGFFYNKTVVCAGFTLAYSYLLKQLGIPCEYVSSDAMGHAWNKVCIDDSWYNVDLTFDNADQLHDETTYGSMQHCYFMKSDTFFSSNESIHWHYDGFTNDGCEADSTLYDDAFWTDITSRIYVVNGDYYYLKPTTGYNIELTKHTKNGVESSVGSEFLCLSVTYTGKFTDENKTTHTYSYKDLRARLAYLDSRFYVIDYFGLHSMTLDGTTYEIAETSENYPVGLGVNKKGNLVYHLDDDKNTLCELDKLEYFNNHITAVKGENYHNYPDVNLDGVINGKDFAKIYKDQNS